MVPEPYYHLFGYVSGGLSIVLLALLYGTRLRKSRLWTIVVTPLASIIGSGFLVVTPLLYLNFGRYHLWAILVINLVAIMLGWVLRTNIHYFEPLLDNGNRHTSLLKGIERAASLVLGVSYIISVGFYLSLLSAFSLNILGIESDLILRTLTTMILVFIGVFGYSRGLHGLESLEKFSLSTNLSVIFGLLASLVFSASYLRVNGAIGFEFVNPTLNLESVRILAGMLLIVQGFETARYLGKDYTAGERSRGLLIAQVAAAVTYILFVPLAAPLAGDLTQASGVTAIIGIVGKAAFGLAPALSVAAIFSQFGAAVADTVGTGGILEQETRGRIRRRVGYVIVTGLAVVLIWTLDVFSVLTLASRSFALYYAFQAVIATVLVYEQPEIKHRIVKLILFPFLTLVMLLAALYAIPAH